MREITKKKIQEAITRLQTRGINITYNLIAREAKTSKRNVAQFFKSGTIRSGTIKSGTIKSGTARSGTIKSGTVQGEYDVSTDIGYILQLNTLFKNGEINEEEYNNQIKITRNNYPKMYANIQSYVLLSSTNRNC